jgi:hypothetical protein
VVDWAGGREGGRRWRRRDLVAERSDGAGGVRWHWCVNGGGDDARGGGDTAGATGGAGGAMVPEKKKEARAAWRQSQRGGRRSGARGGQRRRTGCTLTQPFYHASRAFSVT